MLRKWIQAVATVLSNPSLLFFVTRDIYQGRLKSVCVPGLNCYSCPAATGACPLGILQSFFANIRPSFQAGFFHIGFYVIGFLGLLGTIAGRFPCGWLCPFGFFQELMYRIPSRKFAIPKYLTYFKYVLLALFVVLLPLLAVDVFGYGMTWFCKYVCPAGTLEAGIPLMILKPELRELIGVLFYSKLLILFLVLVAMIFTKMPFCRVFCPLGAIYALFNKISIFRMVYHPDKCTMCNRCYRVCPVDIKFHEGANQLECIRCLKCLNEGCRFGAISFEFRGVPVQPPVRKRKEKQLLDVSGK